MAQMAGIVQQLQNERERMAKELRQIDTALAALSGSVGGRQTGGRTLSASARARIGAAQRARWARVKERRQSGASVPKKRTMSAAARKRIAAAQRARWAKVRAAKKTA